MLGSFTPGPAFKKTNTPVRAEPIVVDHSEPLKPVERLVDEGYVGESDMSRSRSMSDSVMSL
jgi:hypothetical protein